MGTESVESFSQHIIAIVNQLGFSDYIFLRTNKNWNSALPCGLLHSMPDEWLQMYRNEHFYEYDLILEYAKCNTLPIFSSQIYDYVDRAPFEIELTYNNRRLIQFYRRLGCLDQYNVPQTAFNGSGHVMLQVCMIGAQRKRLQSQVERTVEALRCLCSAIDEVSTRKYSALFIDQYDKPVVIGSKPLRSLSLFARSDMTINELAGHLFVSPITAHNYIADARKALGVKTNIAAVMKALKLGLISFD